MATKNEVERMVTITLIRIGIKCDLVGFSYLTKAIEYVIEDGKLAYNLKSLYAKVANDFSVKNPIRVEANIQNAITFTYNTKGFESFNQLFGMEVVSPIHKPSTAEFIMLVAEYYNLQLYKQTKSAL